MSDMGASAAKAYMQTVQTLAGKAGGAPSAEEAKGSGFGDILGQAIQSVSQAGNTAEILSTSPSSSLRGWWRANDVPSRQAGTDCTS